jgi:hypothetical protein
MPKFNISLSTKYPNKTKKAVKVLRNRMLERIAIELVKIIDNAMNSSMGNKLIDILPNLINSNNITNNISKTRKNSEITQDFV